MFTNVIENLTALLERIVPNIEAYLINSGLNANNGSMVNHFESARISFNQNGELFMMYGLILVVSLIIGFGVYSVTHTKDKKKKQS